jgi:hypothetical protein
VVISIATRHTSVRASLCLFLQCRTRVGFHLEKHDDDDEGSGARAVMMLTILVALAVIILALALVAALVWRRHSALGRLEHPSPALRQTDPTSGR